MEGRDFLNEGRRKKGREIRRKGKISRFLMRRERKRGQEMGRR